MAVNSRQKGKRSELELVHVLKDDYGIETARRTQQYSGTEGQHDISGVKHLSIEVKNRQKLNLYDAIAQSVRDAQEKEIPIVIHKKNRKDWLVTMRLSDFMNLYMKAYPDAKPK